MRVKVQCAQTSDTTRLRKMCVRQGVLSSTPVACKGMAAKPVQKKSTTAKECCKLAGTSLFPFTCDLIIDDLVIGDLAIGCLGVHVIKSLDVRVLPPIL